MNNYKIDDQFLQRAQLVQPSRSSKTGAMIDVSGPRDTPQRLSDRIITISGQAEQKEGACLGIVEALAFNILSYSLNYGLRLDS